MKRPTSGLVILLLYLVAGCSSRSVQGVVLPPPANATMRDVGNGRDGTKLVIEPRNGVRPVVRAIDAAKRLVFLEAYILTQHSIVRALERAAAQGVAVYVLLDPHPFGMGLQPVRMATSLQAAGVSVRWTWRRYYYTHAKFFVIDDKLGVVSTANFSAAAFTNNRELLVFDRQHSDVHELSNVFRSDWDHIPSESSDSQLILSPGSRRLFTTFLLRARRTIDVYAEEIADPKLDRLLIRLGRHLRVRVLVAATYRSTGATQLLESGVAVRGLGKPYVHAKMFLVDGRVMFVGSENLSPTSLDSNREVGLILKGREVARVAALFKGDWRRAMPVAALPAQ